MWEGIENQRTVLDSVAIRLNIKNFEDWYSVPAVKIREMGGSGILTHYQNSASTMLQKVYPEYYL
jgi:hypothetical protein